jgi:hypothetical protein
LAAFFLAFFFATFFLAFFLALRLVFFLAAAFFFGAAFFFAVTLRFFETFFLEAFLRDFFLVAMIYLRVGYPALSIYNKDQKSSNEIKSYIPAFASTNATLSRETQQHIEKQKHRVSQNADTLML